MNKIEVAVLHEANVSPAGMMMFLAKLTQRGHSITDMSSLKNLYQECIYGPLPLVADKVAVMPHGTIKRFTPITIAIVGASRRFLAQARTHQVGFTCVSASLQYSDYSNGADFVVPYKFFESDSIVGDMYLQSCKDSMRYYRQLVDRTDDNDSAGYASPQGLRNILIMQGNHEALRYFIRTRGCNRNTAETQYVTMLVWKELLTTADGCVMFEKAGPDCCYGQCREGTMTCGKSLKPVAEMQRIVNDNLPTLIIEKRWPLLLGGIVKC